MIPAPLPLGNDPLRDHFTPIWNDTVTPIWNDTVTPIWNDTVTPIMLKENRDAKVDEGDAKAENRDAQYFLKENGDAKDEEGDIIKAENRDAQYFKENGDAKDEENGKDPLRDHFTPIWNDTVTPMVYDSSSKDGQGDGALEESEEENEDANIYEEGDIMKPENRNAQYFKENGDAKDEEGDIKAENRDAQYFKENGDAKDDEGGAKDDEGGAKDDEGGAKDENDDAKEENDDAKKENEDSKEDDVASTTTEGDAKDGDLKNIDGESPGNNIDGESPNNETKSIGHARDGRNAQMKDTNLSTGRLSQMKAHSNSGGRRLGALRVSNGIHAYSDVVGFEPRGGFGSDFTGLFDLRYHKLESLIDKAQPNSLRRPIALEGFFLVFFTLMFLFRLSFVLHENNPSDVDYYLLTKRNTLLLSSLLTDCY